VSPSPFVFIHSLETSKEVRLTGLANVASAEKLATGTSDPASLEAALADEEASRKELKEFLDQCQAEFTYLMITPANPPPPKGSPPLPVLEDFRETEGFGQQILDPQQQQQQHYQQQNMRPQQNHIREFGQNRAAPIPTNQSPAPPGPGNFHVKHQDPQSVSMTRSHSEHPSSSYGTTAEWAAQMQMQAPAPGKPMPEPLHELPSQLTKHHGRGEEKGPASATDKRAPETDSWDFNDSSFPETAAPQPHQQVSSRPDTDVFPAADSIPKSPSRGSLPHRRKNSSSSRRRSSEHDLSLLPLSSKPESTAFKLKFHLRGHLDTIRTVIFSGGGSPGEPEICTGGDDGMIKRFHIPDRHGSHMGSGSSDFDVTADFTHRGHTGSVLSLAAWSPSPNFLTGGRAQGDGWIFSGGQDATIRVWERGRVDPKATIDGHTDAVWALCILPTTLGAIFGQSSTYGPPDRILLVSGAADGTVKVWAVTAPPQLTSPQPSTGRRPGGRTRGNSMSSGSAFPSSPQPTTASTTPFHYTLIHTILRQNSTASPTCITPLSPNGETFVVSYTDAAIIVYDTRTGEEIGNMASLETYDGSMGTSVNAVVATTVGLDQTPHQGMSEEDSAGGGPTGSSRAMAGSGVEGVIISGHEDYYIRFFDANSGKSCSQSLLLPGIGSGERLIFILTGQCTYNMVAHPAAISSLSLSPDGRELVSAGHDASLRFWSLEKRSCIQEITSHRVMRGEGICTVVWSQDGRWVVSGGGDGVVKVFAR